MKLLPQNRWKKILLITLPAIAVTSPELLSYGNYTLSNDVETQTDAKNELTTHDN